MERGGDTTQVATTSVRCLSGIHSNQSHKSGLFVTDPPPSFQQPGLFYWNNQEQPTVADMGMFRPDCE